MPSTGEVSAAGKSYERICSRTAKEDGSVDSTGVSAIMRSIGQNPSEAEIAVWFGMENKEYI